jgi:hypothetical protein
MLPDIQCDNGLVSEDNWSLGIVGGYNFELVVLVLHEPSPTRSELSGSLGGKLLLESIIGTKIGIDLGSNVELRIWGTSSVWRHAIPEKGVVEMLSSIIEHALVGSLERLCHNILKTHVGKVGTLDGIVQLSDVASMMLAIMKSNGLSGGVRLQSVFAPWKSSKSELSFGISSRHDERMKSEKKKRVVRKKQRQKVKKKLLVKLFRKKERTKKNEVMNGSHETRVQFLAAEKLYHVYTSMK